jgi:hypothetical protein
VKGKRSTKFKPLMRLFTSLTRDDMHIQDDDYIKEIFGHAGSTLNSLGFVTYKGHKKVFGSSKNGAFFRYMFP